MLEPLRDSVVIRPDEAPNKTASGLHIAQNWDNKPPTGTVEAIGDEVTTVKEGDRVVFMRYGSIQTQDKDLRLIKADHILARING